MSNYQPKGSAVIKSATASIVCALALGQGAAHASTAYGTTHNFDCVNDTGETCHGFEIEIDDVHSKDITYTYDWNHYGKPKITEDNADPLHPKVHVRYESAKNANATWAAFTSVPSGPITPTQGHSFTNPGVNFGGEHFGVGYYGTPTAVKYNWLVDRGGVLTLGPLVQVSTPTFTYNPPVGGVAAQVQAHIQPPPAPPVLEFGPASWVKEIRTSLHNNNEVKLRDLVSDDPLVPPLKNWRNGEPDEVEVEWQLLQTDFLAVNGGVNGNLDAAAEPLAKGDEVITRRYEFYAYTGPIDPETGEGLADIVAADGQHGVGMVTDSAGTSYDLSTIVIVGDYLGAQMSAFDAAAGVGVTEHVQDGVVNTAYASRSVVIGGQLPFTVTRTGALPTGMSLDTFTGILSGTPQQTGLFTFTVNASDAKVPMVTRTYTFTIAAAAAPQPPHSTLDTSASPPGNGTTAGDGPFNNGTNITAVAIPGPGLVFKNWTDNGAVVSYSTSYMFTTDVNRSLVANFVPVNSLAVAAPNALKFEWPVSAPGWLLQESPDLSAGSWVNSARPVTVVGAQNRVNIPNPAGHRYFRLTHP